jgi:hypothetical protein
MPKLAKIRVWTQKLSPISSLEFLSWCKSCVHRVFHREAGFNLVAPGFSPGGRFQPGGTGLYTGRPGPGAHRFFTGNHLLEGFRHKHGAHRPLRRVPRCRARRRRLLTRFARIFAPMAIFRFAIKGASSPTVFKCSKGVLEHLSLLHC